MPGVVMAAGVLARIPTRLRGRTRQVAVLVAYLATVAMNGLANALPFAGRTTGEISDRFPIPFTPPGYVFSIWAVIYLGLGAYAVYQARPALRNSGRLNAVGTLFVASCLVNVGWLLAWHWLAIELSLLFMLALLASLLLIHTRLRADGRVDRRERWLVQLPFSIYFGWITVATVANVSVLLYDWGWRLGGGAALGWSAALVVVATLIGGAVLIARRDPPYALVLVWAFSGIAVKESAAAPLGLIALAAAVLLAAGAAAVAARGRRGASAAL